MRWHKILIRQKSTPAPEAKREEAVLERLVLSGLVLAGVCLVGCAQSPTREEFLRKEAECLKCYCASNGAAAEAALLECARYARQCQKAGVNGIKYDEVCARIYGRLYLVERHLGNSGTAEHYLQKVVPFYALPSSVPGRTAPPTANMQTLIEEKVDRGLKVAWKTQ